MTTIIRAVSYGYLPDGTVRVILAEPWTGKRRLDQFPARIRERIDVISLLFAGPLERQRLIAARSQGREIEDAVKDDVRCVRATARLALEGDLSDPLLAQALLVWGDDARRDAELHAMRLRDPQSKMLQRRVRGSGRRR